MKSWKSFLVIYDVEDNIRRSKVVRILESYGIRVQKSAFECYVDKTRLADMKERLFGVIGCDDSIRIYEPNHGGYDISKGTEIELYSQGSVII